MINRPLTLLGQGQRRRNQDRAVVKWVIRVCAFPGRAAAPQLNRQNGGVWVTTWSMRAGYPNNL